MTEISFDELVKQSRKPNEDVYQGTLLALDPGHTTGWAVFSGTELLNCGHIDTSLGLNEKVILNRLRGLFRSFEPTHSIIEDYRVYKHMVKEHANSELHTPKLIGMITVICLDEAVEYHRQMAAVAKQFANDKMLHNWGLYQKGLRHANDAIRHGAHYICFGARADWSKRQGRKKGMTVG